MAYEFQTAGISRLFPDSKKARSIKTMHSFADSIIADAIAHLSRSKPTPDPEKGDMPQPLPSERYVFLHALLAETQDPYTLRSELLNVLLAGRDTTAGLLSNTWWVLARRRDIWDKLQAEIRDRLPDGRPPTYAVLKDMKFIRYLLNESLRLMPIVPSNSRTAVRDTVLPVGGGPDGSAPVLVPAGTVVGYSSWSMHRRFDFYGPDALEFRPERWENLRPRWEYLPFNGGPRICLGQQFALLETSYATVRLCQAFARGVEPRDDRDWSEMITLTLSSGTGCWVGLSR